MAQADASGDGLKSPAPIKIINGEEVMDSLTALNEAGTTIAMVTHSPHDSEYSHRIIHLFDGHVVTENYKEKFHV